MALLSLVKFLVVPGIFYEDDKIIQSSWTAWCIEYVDYRIYFINRVGYNKRLGYYYYLRNKSNFMYLKSRRDDFTVTSSYSISDKFYNSILEYVNKNKN